MCNEKGSQPRLSIYNTIYAYIVIKYMLAVCGYRDGFYVYDMLM